MNDMALKERGTFRIKGTRCSPFWLSGKYLRPLHPNQLDFCHRFLSIFTLLNYYPD